MTHRCPIKLDQFDVMLGHQTDATSTTIAILTKLAQRITDDSMAVTKRAESEKGKTVRS
jgi:hypothetical protein